MTQIYKFVLFLIFTHIWIVCYRQTFYLLHTYEKQQEVCIYRLKLML
jgi:hypothetical protein